MPENFTVIPDLAYSPDHFKHKLNLFLPVDGDSSTEKRPLILFVHGGGWKRGDRNWIRGMYHNVGRTMAKNGFACAVISYRLAILSHVAKTLFALLISSIVMTVFLLLSSLLNILSFSGPLTWVWTNAFVIFFVLCLLALSWFFYIFQGDPFEYQHQLEDVGRSLKYMIDHADEYNIDKSRIFLMGHSAGAHLITLLDLNEDCWRACGLTSSDMSSIRGVVSISGPYNLGRLNKHPLYRQWYIVPAFGIAADTTSLRKASPLTYVRPKSHPFLLLNAAWDFHLPRDAKEFQLALEKVGNRVEMANASMTHGSIIHEIGTTKDRVSPIILDFIARCLSEKAKK